MVVVAPPPGPHFPTWAGEQKILHGQTYFKSAIVNYYLFICCISDLGRRSLQGLGACPEGSCLIGTVALGLGGLGCSVQVLDGGAGGVECGDCLETVAGPRLQTSL